MQYDDLIRQLREVQQRIPDELIQRYLRAAINRLQRFKDDGTIIPRSSLPTRPGKHSPR